MLSGGGRQVNEPMTRTCGTLCSKHCRYFPLRLPWVLCPLTEVVGRKTKIGRRTLPPENRGGRADPIRGYQAPVTVTLMERRLVHRAEIGDAAVRLGGAYDSALPHPVHLSPLQLQQNRTIRGCVPEKRAVPFRGFESHVLPHVANALILRHLIGVIRAAVLPQPRLRRI
jgi:hypothetical protein